MNRTHTRRPVALAACLLACLLLAPAAASALTKPRAPRATTGGATHVLPTSALLTGHINPSGPERVTYFFQYGLTTAYGSQTPTASVAGGTVPVAVGQPVTGLVPGAVYHFRIVAANAVGTTFGRDHTTKGTKLAFEIPRTAQDVFGSPFILTGTLTGQSAANHRIALQASPFPYLEPFTTIGLPGVTNSAGRFSFRVANLNASTQFRVSTLDALPVYSRVLTVSVDVRVVLHVRVSSRGKLVRLYGTITPAVSGATVSLQVQKAVRPNPRSESETATRYTTQFSTKAKRGPHNTSRFSIVTKIRRGGRYRAFVRPRPGPLAPGTSNTLVLRATKK